jgi:ketosteroid isomerase-like protein
VNEHDAEAAAAFFTADAVWTTPQGTFYGRRSIERRLANYHFRRWHITNEVITVDRVISVGDQVRAIGTWSNTVQEPDGSTEDFNGRFTSDLVLQGDTWKIRTNTYDQSRSY